MTINDVRNPQMLSVLNLCASLGAPVRIISDTHLEMKKEVRPVLKLAVRLGIEISIAPKPPRRELRTYENAPAPKTTVDFVMI